MRVLIVPLIAPLIFFSSVLGEPGEEPDEVAMRGAFEQTLAQQVRNAVAFVAESGGPQVVEQIQRNGTDRFSVRAFEKQGCARLAEQHAYRCDFTVAIDVVSGSFSYALTGQFLAAPQGWVFALEEAQPSSVAIL